MFNLNNIPLLSKKQAVKVLFELNEDGESMTEDYLICPGYEWLPEKEKINEDAKYRYRLLNQDEYLTGLSVISAKPLSPRFCNDLLTCCGLVIRNSSVYTQEGGENWNILQQINFEHVSMCTFWNQEGMATLGITGR